jgi:glycerol kinase|tara:strand:- start:8481 stop:9926 length:1446 start_codon:yes stop_codon:yes gene_type:complete
MSKILTIDQGTTSSRSIIFDQNANIQVSAQEEYPLLFPNDGWVEIQPDDLYHSVLNTLNQLDLSEIKYAGITNQRETTIIWDRETHEPIYNAIVWQDRRTSDYCESISSDANKLLVKDKTGLIIDSYFSATKIKWILDNIEGAREKASAGKLCFGTVDSFLLFKLSNGAIHKTDITNASRTMLFNINSLEWDNELLELFDVPSSILPEVEHSDTNFGALTNLNNIEVHGILGDQQAALFGQGCLAKGELKSTYGTGCFLMANVGHKPLFSNDGLLTTIGYSLNGQITYAIEGSIYAAGTTVQWLRDNLEFFSSSELSENFLNPNGNSNNIHFVPAFTGLGAPYWNSDIRASYHGITSATSKADMINAAFNSITYQTKDIIHCLSKIQIELKSLNVDGGMVANKTFTQQLANLLNIDVLVPENSESTARGVAVLAGVASKIYDLGLVKDQSRSKITPVKNDHEYMSEDYRKWKKLIDKALLP